MKTKLPHQTDRPFLTDGGLETTLIFHNQIELPHFAAFDLLKSPAGRATLRDYFRTYAGLARDHGVGFVLEGPTWRANPDWGKKLGYTEATLAQANRDAMALLHEIRDEFETPDTPIIISGCLGPRGDGYQPSSLMTAREAAAYHAAQIRVLRDAGADLISAFTMNYVEEAIGIADAAAALGISAVISFTTETDGKLPSGQTLGEAIQTVDAAATDAPAYYMINCAHPTHLRDALPEGAPWLKRIRGLRANASCRSHAELDESPDLDAGNPGELGEQYRQLLKKLPNLHILGGCCGTDVRHVEAICHSCIAHAHA
jgi:S-methylmethionine-dependent homocysteine/selenocysteine methylase